MNKHSNGISMRAAMVALVLGTGGLLACESQELAGQDQAGASDESVTIALSTVPASTLCIRVVATPVSGSATVKSFIVSPGATSANLQMGVLVPNSYTLAADAFNVACTSMSGAGNWVADPVAITVVAGVPNQVTMTFRKNNPVVVNANFVNNVKSVHAGYSSTFVVTDSGILQAGYFGSSEFTRASFAAFDSSSVPGNAVKSIANTEFGACALRADGTVWCWGWSRYGELGPGIAVNGTSYTPVQVTGIESVSLIAAGHRHTCAWGNSGADWGVFCWGDNSNGQLGNGTTTSSLTPVLASAFRSQFLAAGVCSTYTIDAYGRIRSWGCNTFGQLGDGGSVDRLSPVEMPADRPYAAVAPGIVHACALATNDEVYCWGANSGQIGDGTTTPRLTPTRVPGILAKQVVSGVAHACALTTTGDVFCWGINGFGSLGIRTSEQRYSPTPLSLAGVSFSSLSCQNGYSVCGLSTNREMFCWGHNEFGNLGIGHYNTAYSPVRVQLQ